MPDFSTESLLYPLTKGEFHGNQYVEVPTEGETPTPRPPVGQFQLTPDEMRSLARELSEAVGQNAAQDLCAVKISKMLGLDKPATEVTEPLNRPPDLLRGCDPQGAETLLRPLEHYGNGGGSAYGNGIYTAHSRPVAEQYVEGAMVQMWLNPGAKIAEGDMAKPFEQYERIMRAFSEERRSGHGGMSVDDAVALGRFMEQPANFALSCGYQGWKGAHTVIFDRSALTIRIEKRQRNKDFSY
jgi:hypothetical protein